MNYKIINDLDHDDLFLAAAHLHQISLQENSFITFFGPNFLKEIYKGMIRKQLGFMIVALEGNVLQGFVLGCLDSAQMMSIIKQRFFYFSWLILKGLIRKPSLISKVIEVLKYDDQTTDVAIDSELVVIAVSEEVRSKGIGSQLVTRLEEEFERRGILEYKVTVHQEMERSNHFYRKLGMNQLTSFNLFNKSWYAYTKKIT